jgi:hypothetical protein
MSKLRGCQVCGITAKGMASERAITSPSGVVHLRYITSHDKTGRTFCGRETKRWLK